MCMKLHIIYTKQNIQENVHIQRHDLRGLNHGPYRIIVLTNCCSKAGFVYFNNSDRYYTKCTYCFLLNALINIVSYFFLKKHVSTSFNLY